jgi:hypothetical protein
MEQAMNPYLHIQFIDKGSWMLSNLVRYKIRGGLLTVISNINIAGEVKKLVTVIPMANILSVQRHPEQP